MPFQLLPVLDTMIEFYRKPRTAERFQRYLKLLTDPVSGEIKIPIGAYNPMAREHVREKLEEFATLGSEAIMEQVIDEINRDAKIDSVFQVSLALADDLGGGWTNRHTTDYAMRFQNHGMIRRGFCTPLFWSSEAINAPLIARRTREALHRTIYQHERGEPKTLEEHLRQEAFAGSRDLPVDPRALSDFHARLRGADDHPTIFAFLYGDQAARELGYPPLRSQEPNE